MTRPSKKVREEAILFAAFGASSCSRVGASPYASEEASDLCVDAETLMREMGIEWPELCAEAEALLRDGWCPGDEVVRR